MAAVSQLELSILGCEILGFEDCLGASSHEFGPVCPEIGGESVEAFDEVVVELHQYFTSSHDHMVLHMVSARNAQDPATSRVRGIGTRREPPAPRTSARIRTSAISDAPRLAVPPDGADRFAGSRAGIGHGGGVDLRGFRARL